MKKIIQYLKDVRLEMSKVSWPTRNEVVGATSLVIGLSVAVAIVVRFFDFILKKVFELVLNI
ncbi:MAG: preprotein translocase subunit SecE [Chitinivibrionales bacterium]|nr:preprotein translocase subunit SecE [Chitinivibrionales bacterium]